LSSESSMIVFASFDIFYSRAHGGARTNAAALRPRCSRSGCWSRGSTSATIPACAAGAPRSSRTRRRTSTASSGRHRTLGGRQSAARSRHHSRALFKSRLRSAEWRQVRAGGLARPRPRGRRSDARRPRYVHQNALHRREEEHAPRPGRPRPVERRVPALDVHHAVRRVVGRLAPRRAEERA